MSDKDQQPKSPEVGLSKQRVVTEAIRLADQEGVDSLTMRRLAREMGAGAMSLYHYVANKEQLLDAMIDIVFDEIELPHEGLDWQEAMRRRANSAREVLSRHPWAIALMESRTSPGPANLRHRETVITCLRQAGFSIMMATHANWLIDSYIYGYALQETSLPFDTADDLTDMTVDVILPQLSPEEFPYLNESASALMAAGYDPKEEFGFGLDLVLKALEDLRLSN